MAGTERELEAVLDEQDDGMVAELDAQVDYPSSTVQVEQDYMVNIERTVQAQQFTIEALQQRVFALNVDIVNLTAEALSKAAKQPS